MPEPEPLLTSTGTTILPEPVPFKEDQITMSSMWKDERMKPWNVIKTANFNAKWGQGEFTCIHTLHDEAGPWWQAKFGATVTVTKVQVLNRGDCCERRIEGAKVFIGETLFGSIEEGPKGGWITLTNHVQGDFIKIQGVPK